MPSITPAAVTQTAPPLLRRAESLGFQVNQLARLLEGALRERIAPYGVAPGQFAQLLALYEQDGVSQSELCRAVQIDQSTMALTVRRMERDGLISRRPSLQDKRQTEVWLTDRARELEFAMVTCAQEANAAASAGISPADLATAVRVLGEMISALLSRGETVEP